MSETIYTGSKRRFRVEYSADHRDGYCEQCGTKTEKIPTTVISRHGTPKDVIRPLCPKCGGQGRLISRNLSVKPPDPPQCASPKCLLTFILDCLFAALVSNYHRRRVAYAEANRNKVILDRYRTGEPAPKTIWQAIHANIKLACPVCRKYDVDPLLFAKKGG